MEGSRVIDADFLEQLVSCLRMALRSAREKVGDKSSVAAPMTGPTAELVASSVYRF